MSAPKNWTRSEKNKKQTIWVNTTDYSSAVENEKVGDTWIVSFDSTKSEYRGNIAESKNRYKARKKAVRWMRNNPNP